MSHSTAQRMTESVGYWVRRVLLTFFGPARLDADHDPIEQLKREHRDFHRDD
ncbi:MAG: hypothetical protein R2737_14670 [Candidatus Nanopelagicales bacterium]